MTGAVVANAFALAAVVGYVARQAYPATEAVRIRNAFLIESGSPGDFDWTPANLPPAFKTEQRTASPLFVEVVQRLGLDSLDSDSNKALVLAAHLSEHAADRGPIRSDLATTYRRIREGYGYCADFVRVFLALAHAAGLFARQWAFSFDGFGGHGHTFVEVYDRARGKWCAIDVYNNFHFASAASGEPLGALEIRVALASGGHGLAMRPNGPGRPGYVLPEKGLDYYRRGLDEWYLWWGNAVFSREAQPLVQLARHFSDRLADLAGYVAGVQPHIRVLASEENVAQRRAIARLKTRLQWAAMLAALLCGALVVQIGFGDAAAPARR